MDAHDPSAADGAVRRVGCIDVRWDNMRIREVDAFLTSKFVAEKRQEARDRLQEQKFMRLRERQDRKDKTDMVTRLLKVGAPPRSRPLLPAARPARELRPVPAHNATPAPDPSRSANLESHTQSPTAHASPASRAPTPLSTPHIPHPNP